MLLLVVLLVLVVATADTTCNAATGGTACTSTAIAILLKICRLIMCGIIAHIIYTLCILATCQVYITEVG